MSGVKWHLSDTGYAVWRGVLDGKKQTIRMHRLLTKAPIGKVVDHLNHNRLDNRKCNLRVCTVRENLQNLSNHGKGYWYQKQNRNWVVEVYGKHIGCFSTEKEAAEVAKLVRSGGTYIKPERTRCVHGHSLTEVGFYMNRGTKTCKKCHLDHCRNYYRRKHGRK